MWHSQCNYLLRIGRIGENFLVTSHRSIEYHFSNTEALGSNGLTIEHSAVGQR